MVYFKKWRWSVLVAILLVAALGSVKFIKEDATAPSASSIAEPVEVAGDIKDTAGRVTAQATDWAKRIDIVVDTPFTAQAPSGHWEDERQQDGCEEAAVLMAMKWVRRETLTAAAAEKTIIDMADWQNERYGGYVNTNAQDTADRLFKGYFFMRG